MFSMGGAAPEASVSGALLYAAFTPAK